ncbi:MAG: hypothetical protein UF030_01305 [Eggerthellaceae bacterium]|nr:hypothetical protein [Eggerthellaceae bacterium]
MANIVTTLMTNLMIAMEVGLTVATAAGLVGAAAVVDLVVITATAGLVVAVMAIGLRLFWTSLNCLKSAMRKMKQSS